MSVFTHQGQQGQQEQQEKDPSLILLGPLPYNRFIGNPPSEQTAEQAFEAENGFPWLVQLTAQPVLDKINKLQSEVTSLQAQLKSQTQPVQTQNPKTHKV